MLTVVLILHVALALGLIGLGLRYGTGAVPLDYHARILERDGARPGAATVIVLRALYRSLAGLCVALGLTVFGLSALFLAAAPAAVSALILLSALAAGTPAVLVPRQVEAETGVRTPWRAGLVLVLLAAAAAALTLPAG
jgi:hypothetical protein